ncbi:hypothetical protein FHW58_005469 [Duganella sp. 1224]|uniref:hypothetical protein n=1 Tax=Duganella sp. 1224 TaxID=2587052 RepID=UPI0015C825FD|nr:hypothetical protein [Duganella sp. 1224]NYE64231.1 hypothetical protein [Duganella sp. 1224]
MKKYYAGWLLCLAVSACVQAQESTPLQQVIKVIASPKVYGVTGAQLMRQLAPSCKPSTLDQRTQYKRGNVECVAAVGADVFSVSPEDGKVTLVQATFAGAAHCDAFKQALINNFGKPSKSSGACALSWRLAPASKGGPARQVELEGSAADDKVYLTLGEEQGP